MKVVHVAFECAPIYKTGGLGDVVGSLPQSQVELGLQVIVVIPGYGWIRRQSRIPHSKVPVYYAESRYFHIPDPTYDPKKQAPTFAHFCLQTLDLLKKHAIKPDIIHCHDWHTALIPFLIKKECDVFFEKTKTVLTIHNAAFQGNFPVEYLEHPETASLLNYFSIREKKISFLKLGIKYADFVTTVSPNYAREITHTKMGFGLQTVLKQKKTHFDGVVNGIDVDIWNPKTDSLLEKKYSYKSFQIGKAQNKRYLQKYLKLSPLSVPLISCVTRLSGQKGIDILIPFIEKFGKMKIQLVILGTGDRKLEDQLKKYQTKTNASWYSLNLFFGEKLAHQIYAASDFFLIPSHFEPCGLTQMISMRYGTIPIASAVGGLKDTIEDGKTGFLFKSVTSNGLERAAKKAMNVWENKRQLQVMRKRIMKVNFSWKQSARLYIKIYQKVLDHDRFTR